jgi:hypothetical protein
MDWSIDDDDDEHDDRLGDDPGAGDPRTTSG